MSRVALGAILLGAGVLWLLSALDVVDLSYRTWIGLLLLFIGFAIVLTPGRHGLLVLVGVLVVLAGLPSLVVDENVFEGGIGDSVETPSSTAELEPYRHGIGKLTVDLTSPSLRTNEASVEASLGIGELVVRVPLGSDVSVDAHAGMGNVDALGHEEGGIGVDVSREFAGLEQRELSLELEVGIGNIRVEQSP